MASPINQPAGVQQIFDLLHLVANADEYESRLRALEDSREAHNRIVEKLLGAQELEHVRSALNEAKTQHELRSRKREEEFEKHVQEQNTRIHDERQALEKDRAQFEKDRKAQIAVVKGERDAAELARKEANELHQRGEAELRRGRALQNEYNEKLEQLRQAQSALQRNLERV